MRSTTLIAFVAGLAIATGASILLREDPQLPPQATLPALPRATQTAEAAAPANAPMPTSMPRTTATPTLPRYAPDAEEPRRIYRCRSGSRTVYSNEPCPGARIVDETSAVSGFDSRPSDRMARLVAEGRGAAIADAAPTVITPRALPPQSAECALLAQQIRDIDAEALRPNSLRTLDELRRIRQDVRTRMALLHC